jgi:hypothetical protein
MTRNCIWEYLLFHIDYKEKKLLAPGIDGKGKIFYCEMAWCAQ